MTEPTYDQLKQQLAQAQATVHDQLGLLQENENSLRKYLKDNKWLSPDEAKALREHDCENVQCRQVHLLLDSLLARYGRMVSPEIVSAGKAAILCDEMRAVEEKAKHLEAECAVKKKLLSQLTWCEWDSERQGHYELLNVSPAELKQALSTTAGKDLLEKLERYEKALREITKSGWPNGCAEVSVNIAREALKGDE